MVKYHKVFSLNSSLYVEKLKRIDLDHFDESGKMLRIPSEIFPPPLSKKLLLIISLVLVQKLSLLFCSSAWNFYLKLRGCLIKKWTGLNIKIDLVQKVYEWWSCSFAKMIVPSGTQVGKRTASSLIYFLNYAYFDI